VTAGSFAREQKGYLIEVLLEEPAYFEIGVEGEVIQPSGKEGYYFGHLVGVLF